MVSGQAPNPETQADCQVYDDVDARGRSTADGQVLGQGCVYPAGRDHDRQPARGGGLTWRGYMEDMAAGLPDEPRAAAIPTSTPRIDTQTAEADDQYAARHNPFVYFHSIIDLADLRANDVDLSAGCRRPAPRGDDARTTPSSRPTSATTATTSRASTAGPAA